MKKLRLALSPIVAAAGILALSGVSVAQMVVVSSANCPQVKATKEKITEDQARDLAQLYADKNLAGYRVVRPSGYGGGYNTVCVRKDPATGKVQSFYSVEYLIDAINSAGETRNLRVDQYGYVTEFTGTEAALIR
jgi:hypothetical protein